MERVVGLEEEWWQPGNGEGRERMELHFPLTKRGTCLTLIAIQYYYHVVALPGKIIKMAFNGRDCWYFLFSLFSVALRGSALYK